MANEDLTLKTKCKFNEILEASEKSGINIDNPIELLRLMQEAAGKGNPNEAIDQIHSGLEKLGMIKDSQCKSPAIS